ncbi:hypothetical protein CW748_07720 [Alteromonadales bacterium alter-6D02]|nr:hypothetical protein CW748_07720 [Alteromonadales bacterium alter-6D02]
MQSVSFGLLFFTTITLGANWSNTELQIQTGGELSVPGGGESTAHILTFQHASAWDYGDNFFFVDHTRWSGGPGDETSEFYGEWYSHFSLGAISGKKLGLGPVKDIGIVAGINLAPEVDSSWWLPGVRLSLDLDGFTFAQVDITAYLHQGGGNTDAEQFTIVDEESSYMIDFSWAYPFKLGDLNWSIEGHLEYINGREQVNNFQKIDLSSWLLFQPQLRLDVGDLLIGKHEQLFFGVEYQYWKHKLGTKNQDDNALQLLLVWRF